MRGPEADQANIDRRRRAPSPGLVGLALGLSLFALLGSTDLTAGPAKKGAKTVPYGEPVHYEKGLPLHFKDLDLVYLGTRHVTSEVFPNGFDYEDFDVVQGEHTITIYWTSGTGDIGPTYFQRSGHKYALELRISQWAKPGRGLASDELMLWKDPKD